MWLSSAKSWSLVDARALACMCLCVRVSVLRVGGFERERRRLWRCLGESTQKYDTYCLYLVRSEEEKCCGFTNKLQASQMTLG